MPKLAIQNTRLLRHRNRRRLATALVVATVGIVGYGATTVVRVSLQPANHRFLVIGAGQVAVGHCDQVFVDQWKILRSLGEGDPIRPRIRLGWDYRSSGPWHLLSLPLWPVAVSAVAIALWLSRRKMVGGSCPNCDYDLVGTPPHGDHLTCPECGRVLNSQRALKAIRRMGESGVFNSGGKKLTRDEMHERG